MSRQLERRYINVLIIIIIIIIIRSSGGCILVMVNVYRIKKQIRIFPIPFEPSTACCRPPLYGLGLCWSDCSKPPSWRRTSLASYLSPTEEPNTHSPQRPPSDQSLQPDGQAGRAKNCAQRWKPSSKRCAISRVA